GAAFMQAVEPLGDSLVGSEGEGLRALVDLDTGNDALGAHHLYEGGAVRRALAQRLVIEDDAGDVVAAAGCREQQLAIIAPVLFRARHADAVEAALDGARTLVRREDALAGSDQGSSRAFQFREVHDNSP